MSALLIGLLEIAFDLARGIITEDEARIRAAELAAVDKMVDELERKKLGE